VVDGVLYTVDQPSKTLPASVKYASQVAAWNMSPLHDEDVSNLQHFRALEYMSAVQRDAQRMMTTWIPSIPKDFIFNFEEEPWTFQPNDVWALRHLDLGPRYQEHANFVHLGLLLANSGQDKIQFFSAWKVLRQRTDELRRREQAFYQKFIEEPEHETNEERRRRTQEWAQMTAKQALPAYIDPRAEQSVQFTQAGHKRALEHDDVVKVQHPAKRTRVDSDTNGHPVSVQEKTDGYQQSEAPKCGVSELVQEEETPYWKRKYPGDDSRLPEHPFLNVSDYTIQADTLKYRCFHKESKCSYGNCSHRCCKDGYDEAGLKKAIHKAVTIYKVNVEKNINKGLLNKKHKWWSETFAKEKTRKSAPARDSTRQSTPQQAASTAAPQTHPQFAQTALPTPALPPQGPTAYKLAGQDQQRRENYQQRLTLHNQRTARKREAHIAARQFPNLQYFDKYWNARRPLAEDDKLTDEEVRWKGVPRKPEQLKDEPLPAMPLLGLVSEILDEKTAAVEPVPETPSAVEQMSQATSEDDGMAMNAALGNGGEDDDEVDSLFGDAAPVPEGEAEDDGLAT
jgi:hypothetical protein